MAGLLYLLFFLSGVSGLIYQVVWVREFGNVFGNTVYSTSIVLAIFMLGLGFGSYVVGIWADRRYREAPGTLLRAYGYVELVIAALGLAISLVLPALGALSAALSSYTTAPNGWFVLAPMSYVARALIAIVLLAPITLLMGGTLTLLIRHLVRANVLAGGWTIAVLYGVNTAGAATGAFLTDFILVPATGLWVTQLIAVALNAAAGVGALFLARVAVESPAPSGDAGRIAAARHAGRKGSRRTSREVDHAVLPSPDLTVLDAAVPTRAIVWTSLAIALSGFAAMGMEILWLRHFNLLLGGFRAVFSLLVTVVLVGIGLGSLIGGAIVRRTGRPAQALMAVQALFVLTTLVGLGTTNVEALRASGQAIEASLPTYGVWQRAFVEFWYNVRPMLRELGVPALLMGCAFPLANAVIQRAERAVGRRAGVLYLANTAGAVAGSLVAGYVLLPLLGMQGAATVLAGAAALAILPLYLAAAALGTPTGERPRAAQVGAIGGLAASAALVVWIVLPAEFLVRRSLASEAPAEDVLALSEGVTEIIAVTEAPGRGRALMTNGHPMSSTALLDQRYMRALAHVPLLAMESPERVLIIGFGVGNTTHAAALHDSVARVDVADLSAHVLEHAAYFENANGAVLDDPRVAVYVNDGRQHLQMVDPGTYDLITLEPPPISYAGVGALYSREFYELARTRLTPGGYLTQWLPAYQVPADTSLAMVRAFLDVFPQTVLLSGAQAELLLVGTTAPRNQVDPDRLAARLQADADVRADLVRLELGTVREIVGSFVGSPVTLEMATAGVQPVTDDRPLQEYGVRSVIGSGQLGVPATLFNLDEIASWCPRCFDDGGVPRVEGLDTYLALLTEAYLAPVEEVAAAAAVQNGERRILGSAYLGAVVPDSAEAHNVIGVVHLREGRTAEAMASFSEALVRDPASAEAARNLGGVLYDIGSQLLEEGRYDEAAQRLDAAIQLMPESAEAHNNMGIALASLGDLDRAILHFRQAVTLAPWFAEAQRNLAAALTARG